MAHGGQSGRAIVLTGSLAAVDHLNRLAGFRAVLEHDFPSIEIAQVIETRDLATKVRETVSAACTPENGITAIYNVGAGNIGLIDALRITTQQQPFCCIVHELVPHTRRALEDGTIDVVIDQRPEIEVNRALAHLRALVDAVPPPPTQELIPAIHVRDNLPNANS